MGIWLALTNMLFPDFNKLRQIRLWLNKLLGVQKPVRECLLSLFPFSEDDIVKRQKVKRWMTQ